MALSSSCCKRNQTRKGTNPQPTATEHRAWASPPTNTSQPPKRPPALLAPRSNQNTPRSGAEWEQKHASCKAPSKIDTAWEALSQTWETQRNSERSARSLPLEAEYLRWVKSLGRPDPKPPPPNRLAPLAPWRASTPCAPRQDVTPASMSQIFTSSWRSREGFQPAVLLPPRGLHVVLAAEGRNKKWGLRAASLYVVLLKTKVRCCLAVDRFT